jgi:hypothetical protein
MSPKEAEAVPEETEAEQQARVFAKLREMGSGTKTEDEESSDDSSPEPAQRS